MEGLFSCPACGNHSFSPFLSAKDYFLTQELFSIVQCDVCSFRFTNPRPEIHEVDRYYASQDYLSHDTSNKSILQVIYQAVRNITIRSKYKIIKKYSAGPFLLDIGCGTGELINYCRSKNFLTIGIEPNSKARNFAINKYGLNVIDESHLAVLPNNSFHIITLWHVLEHVHEVNDRLSRARELLLPGGTLLIAVPNSDSWDAITYREFWAAYDLPRHLYHFTHASLKNLATKNGFLLEKIIPMKFDSFYISLLSEKYLTGKQNYLKAFLNGIKSNNYARKNHSNYSSLIYICKIAQDAK